MTTATKSKAQQNGQPDLMAEAREYEQAIADKAAAIRGDATELTPELFGKLYPFLTAPIPPGYIQEIGEVKGKPYDSTGIRSVQVQHDRMNNVLTPWGWDERVTYEQDGKLCHITVRVLAGEKVIYERSSYGGVDRANTLGNLRKGAYTNAAKVAFARVGPGREVYVGALDLDPDVSQQAAAQQAKPDPLPEVKTITAAQMAELKDEVEVVMDAREDEEQRKAFLDDFKRKLGAMGVAGVATVNAGLSKLTPSQAAELSAWLAER